MVSVKFNKMIIIDYYTPYGKERFFNFKTFYVGMNVE